MYGAKLLLGFMTIPCLMLHATFFSSPGVYAWGKEVQKNIFLFLFSPL